KESWNNPILNICTVVGILLQIAVLAFEPLRKLLKLAEVSLKDVVIIFVIAIAGVLVNAAITLAKERLDIKKERNL
ncbi:MAG: hypothetical protein K6F97_05545, partial [Lachnospiraceae bacterium]|nr:hypothetical protein [Lachnospiraceae bacterium]